MERPPWYQKLDKVVRIGLALAVIAFAWNAAMDARPQAREWHRIAPVLFLPGIWMLLWFPLQPLKARFGEKWWMFLLRPLVSFLAVIGLTMLIF